MHVIRLGNPILRQVALVVEPQELKSADFQTFLDDLTATCLEGNGAGIAAPQVGVSQRVIVVHVDPANPRYPGKKPFPLTVVINPVVTGHSQELAEDWEGDMSAGIRAMVPRWRTCRVEGLDRHGREVKFNLNYDFHARVFQHEIDHLDGKFFVDRVKRTEAFTETAEWEKYWKDK